MSRSAMRIVLAIVALAAGIAAWQWMRHKPEIVKPAAAPPAAVVADSSPSTTSAAPRVAASAPSTTSSMPPRDRSISFNGPTPSTALAMKYENETDRRALFDQLQPSSDPQAPFFAAKILRECMDMTNKGLDAMQRELESKLSTNMVVRNKQAEAFQKLKSPCAKFFGRPTTNEEVEALEAEGVQRGDSRAIARALALGRMDPKLNPAQVAEQVLDQGDPYVIADVATWLAQQQNGRMTIMGAPVSSADTVAANIAWQLVACDRGLPCGPDSPQVLSACAFDGNCGRASYEDLVRQSILNPQQYQRAQELRARIEAALEARDFGSLGIGARSGR